MLKHWIVAISLFGFVGFTACNTEKSSENTSAAINLDAEGEADSLTNLQNSVDENTVIKATCNGKAKTFQHVNPLINPDPNTKTYYNRRKDGSYSSISFTRGTTNDLREEITFLLSGIDPETIQYPYTWECGSEGAVGKSVRVSYAVKKSAVPIMYSSASDCRNVMLTLTGYKDGVLEGKFAAAVVNTGQRVIEIQDGSFKVKLDKREID